MNYEVFGKNKLKSLRGTKDLSSGPGGLDSSPVVVVIVSGGEGTVSRSGRKETNRAFFYLSLFSSLLVLTLFFVLFLFSYYFIPFALF